MKKTKTIARRFTYQRPVTRQEKAGAEVRTGTMNERGRDFLSFDKKELTNITHLAWQETDVVDQKPGTFMKAIGMVVQIDEATSELRFGKGVDASYIDTSRPLVLAVVKVEKA
jgi:hypothetical protein